MCVCVGGVRVCVCGWCVGVGGVWERNKNREKRTNRKNTKKKQTEKHKKYSDKIFFDKKMKKGIFLKFKKFKIWRKAPVFILLVKINLIGYGQRRNHARRIYPKSRGHGPPLERFRGNRRRWNL